MTRHGNKQGGHACNTRPSDLLKADEDIVHVRKQSMLPRHSHREREVGGEHLHHSIISQSLGTGFTLPQQKLHVCDTCLQAHTQAVCPAG